MHYHGLLGSFAYNSSGVGIFATSIGTIKNGKIVPVGFNCPGLAWPP